MGADNKRRQILDAAVAIMEKKGTRATISEIAAVACVNDSTIYHYFKDKEDLLFHTVGAYVKNRNNTFLAQLQGIRDPSSRLRRLVWEQLHFHETNPNYAKFTIFFCRSKKSFFRHESFLHFVNWSRILLKILEDGVREKKFSAGLPVKVARDMILGFIDMEEIDFFTGHRPKPPRDDFDEIIDTIMYMLTDNEDNKGKERDKRKRILAAAEDIFAKKDYHSATTIEIARSAQVSEATMYEYFTSKEDILLSGLQYRLKMHLNIADKFFEVRTPISRLIRFIYYHFTMHIREPAFVKNFILNGIFNPNFYSSPAYSDFQSYMAIIDKIIAEGKAEGSFRPALDSRHFQRLFLGVFSYTALRWLLTDDNKKFEMLGRINDIINLLTKIVLAPGRSIDVGD